MIPRPISGYAYTYRGKGCWRQPQESGWEIGMYTPDRHGGEKYVGTRTLGGVSCNVWRTDSGYVAQSCVMTGGAGV